jgi:uncharacterized protein
MTMTSHGFAPTLSASRYIQQLVKHWGHKFATSYSDGIGTVPFSETANARFEAAEDGVHIILRTPGEDEDVRMRAVIERHLDRFAFREAPLLYHWEKCE